MGQAPRRSSSRGERLAEMHGAELQRESEGRVRTAQARLGAAFFCAVLAAVALRFGVRVFSFFGVRPETIADSLVWRIAVPAAAFAVVFVVVYLASGKTEAPRSISAKMTDEEIGKALKSRQW